MNKVRALRRCCCYQTINIAIERLKIVNISTQEGLSTENVKDFKLAKNKLGTDIFIKACNKVLQLC